jgi:Subtilase family
LQHKHRVLFIVSAGNHGDELSLEVDRAALPTTAADVRSALAMRALCSGDMHRRLLAPAESVNALTVGASHSDRSTFNEVPGRYALFPEQGVAPYSRVGSGFRRAVKPDILLPGGRVLFRGRSRRPVRHASTACGTSRNPPVTLWPHLRRLPVTPSTSAGQAIRLRLGLVGELTRTAC